MLGWYYCCQATELSCGYTRILGTQIHEKMARARPDEMMTPKLVTPNRFSPKSTIPKAVRRQNTTKQNKSCQDKSVKRKSRSGRSGWKRCAKCRIEKAFFRLPYCPKKPDDRDKYEKHVAYAAEKFLHDKCMRRIGKSGETRKGERLCSKCKTVKISRSIKRNY